MGPAKIRPPASRSHSWISYEIRAQEALACSLGHRAKSAAVMPAGWPGAIARVRSCSRGGRLAMGSGFSDPAPPAAQPQRLCREVCDRLELELAHSAGAIPVRRASRYPRHRSAPAQLTPAGHLDRSRACARVVPISGTELSPASRSMPNPVHPRMMACAPRRTRSAIAALNFTRVAGSQTWPWQALRTGCRARSPGVRLGEQDVHPVALPQTAEEPDALGHARVEARGASGTPGQKSPRSRPPSTARVTPVM
jgi:hypothetical protein